MRLAVFAALLLLSLGAEAAIYENTIVAEDEEDLFNLEQRGDISSDTRDTLLELIREGVNLNTADRDALYDLPGLTYADVDAILLYRKTKGSGIDDPAELVAAGVITEAQLLELAPFVRLGGAATKLPFSGKARLVTQFMPTDTVPPPALFATDLRGPFDLSAGVMVATTRRSLLPARYGELEDTLVSDGFVYLPHLPRFYLQWKNGDRRVVVGTFTIGFAERLVLDNTRRVTPHGIYLTNDFRRPSEATRTCRTSGLDIISGPCAPGEPNAYIIPDYDWRETFRGVAASLENLDLGELRRLSAYAFVSYQTRSLYQYEIYDRRTCDNPRDDSAECGAPRVYQPGTSTRFVFSTLTSLFDELAGGGHVEFSPTPAVRFGVTGYGAAPFFRDQGEMQLDFQPHSRFPGGGAYGAVGVDAKVVIGPLNLFFEGARSFDRSVGNQGGGWAFEQRSTLSLKGQELELSLRYYDNRFANPYARPIAGPDELDGQRARNEAGVRLRYFLRPNKDWELKASVNAWVLPFAVPTQGPAGMANVYGLVRFNLTGWPAIEPSLWVDLRNRNLASTERGSCASGTIILTDGDPLPCNGDLYKIVGRVEVRPLPNRKLLQLIAQGGHTWRDDIRSIFRQEQRFRQDLTGWAEVRVQPIEWLSLRLRSRYLYQDITDNAYLEHSLWTFLEVGVLPRRGTRLSFRYDLYAYVDQRSSTLTRFPNPEHRFLLDLRTSF